MESYHFTTRCYNSEDLDPNLYPSPSHFTLKIEVAGPSETLVSCHMNYTAFIKASFVLKLYCAIICLKCLVSVLLCF